MNIKNWNFQQNYYTFLTDLGNFVYMFSWSTDDSHTKSML